MKKGILYKDIWLMPGSEAYELHQNKEWTKLERHMARLEDEFRKLHSIEKKVKSE